MNTAAAISAALKEYLHKTVYDTPALVEERQKSASMIASLFNYLMESPGSMPEPYAERARVSPPHRVVCDYIAGMTDGFCLRTASALGLFAA